MKRALSFLVALTLMASAVWMPALADGEGQAPLAASSVPASSPEPDGGQDGPAPAGPAASPEPEQTDGPAASPEPEQTDGPVASPEPEQTDGPKQAQPSPAPGGDGSTSSPAGPDGQPGRLTAAEEQTMTETADQARLDAGGARLAASAFAASAPAPAAEGTVVVEAENYTAYEGTGAYPQSAAEVPALSPSGEGVMTVYQSPCTMTYTVTVETDGLYAVSVWAGGLDSANTGTDTFIFEDMTGKVSIPWDGAAKLHQLSPTDMNGGALSAFALEAGREYTFKVQYGTNNSGEKGSFYCRYDRFVFTRVGDLPAGPATETQVIEAESANSNVDAGGGNFLSVSNANTVRGDGANVRTLNYSAEVGQGGIYHLWAYVGSRQDNTAADTLTIDGAGCTVSIPGGTAPNWQPVRITDGEGQPLALELEQGDTFAFSLSMGAHWCYYDKFVLEKVDELPEPEPEPEPDEDTVTVEAESGAITGTIQTVTGTPDRMNAPSGTGAIRMQGSNDTGSVKYTVSVPKDGLYTIKAYVGSINVNDTGTDIFKIGDFSGQVTVPGNTAPTWKEVAVLGSYDMALQGFPLKAGTSYEFTLEHDLAHWCYYDKFEFTRVGDLPAGPAAETQVIEAESAEGAGDNTGDGNFLSVSGSGAVRGENEGGRTLNYSAEVEQGGVYRLWAYVGSRVGNATNESPDMLAIDGTNYTISIPGGTAPNWQPMRIADGEGQPLALELEKGDTFAFSLNMGAHWCYYDKFVLEKVDELPEPEPEPEPDEDTVTVEAESGEIINGAAVCGTNDELGQVEGSTAVRSTGGAVRIDYSVSIGESGMYRVHARVGRRADNSGTGTVATGDGQSGAIAIDKAETHSWNWTTMTDGEGGERLLALEAGENAFTLTSVENWCYYDKFVFERVGDSLTAGDVSGWIDSLPAPENVSENDREACEKALYWYNVFTARQPDAFTEAQKNKLLACAARLAALAADPDAPAGQFRFEFEDGELSAEGAAFVGQGGDMPGYAGSGYVWLGSGSVTLRFYLPEAGRYDLYLVSGASDEGDKCDYVTLNGGERLLVYTPKGAKGKWQQSRPGREQYVDGALSPQPPASGYSLNAGWNTVTVQTGWGYSNFDSLFIQPLTEEIEDGYAVLEDVRQALEALPAAEDVTAANAQAVKDAYQAYTQLTAEEKEQLTDGQVAALALANARANALLADPGAPAGQFRYEFEDGELSAAGAAFVGQGGDMQGYAGSGYVWLGNGSVTLRFYLPEAGRYDLYLVSGASDEGDKCDYVTLNGGERLLVYTPKGAKGKWQQSRPGREQYVDGALSPQPPASGYSLNAGWNTVTVQASWGYSNFDSLLIQPLTEEIEGGYAVLEDVQQALETLPAAEDVTAVNAQAVKDAYQAYTQLTAEEKEQLTDGQVAALALANARANALLADPGAPAGRYLYELADQNFAQLKAKEGAGEGAVGASFVGQGGSMGSFEGEGYLFLFDGSVTLRFYAPAAGAYRIRLRSGSDDGSDKCDFVSINGGEQFLVYTAKDQKGAWQTSQPGRERYLKGALSPQYPASGFWLEQGWNTITIQASWGYSCYDGFTIEPADGYDWEGFFTLDEVEGMTAQLPWYNEVDIGRMDTVKRIFKAYQSMTADEQYKLSYRGRLLMCNARINALMRDLDAPENRLWYELEEGRVVGNTARSDDAIPYGGYSGSGYVYVFDKGAELDLFVPESNFYNIYLVAGTDPESDKCDYLYLNQTYQYMVATHAQPKQWVTSVAGVEAYDGSGKLTPVQPVGGIWLEEGYNFIELVANWGYNAYDALIIEPGTGSSPDGATQAALQQGRTGPGWPSAAGETLRWEPMDLASLEVSAPAAGGGAKGMARAVALAACGAAAVAGAGAGVGLLIRRRRLGREE